MGKDTFELGGRHWPKVNWWKMKGMRSTYLMLWAALITSATNGYDGSLMNGLESMESWLEDFNHPNGAALGLIVASMYIGSILAIPVVPYIADLLGRRVGIVIGCCTMLLGVALICIGFHVALFIVGRIILGLGLGIAQECSPLLLSEVVHPQHRPQYSTVYNALWYVGSLIGACVSLGTDNISSDWSWRLPCLLQAVPSLSQLFFIWFVPESPRWLVARGHHEKAKKVLAHVHSQGDEEDELVNVEFEEIQQTIELEKEFEKNSWFDLLRTPGNRHRMIILVSIGVFSQLSGNGIISYFLPQVLELIGIGDSQEQLRMNVYMQVVNVISAVGICFFVDKFGRRPLFRISIVGMTICYVAQTIGLAQYDNAADGINENASNAFLVFMFAYYVCYNLAFSGMLVSYSCEILPYRFRAKGLTIMFLCVDVTLFFNTYVNPVALEAIGWKYYIVYCCWLGVECLVVFRYYIETKNTPLEEIARFFDGDAAIIGGDAATAKGRHLSGRDAEFEKEAHETIEVRP